MIYEGCPESIQPFWISLEPVGWPWYNLAASQRPYWDVRVESLSRGASQSAVRRRWLSVCTVWPSYSKITFLSTTILGLGKARSRMKTNLDCTGVLTDLVDVILCQKQKPARELYNGQAHCRVEVNLLARSLWMRWSHSTQARSTTSHCRLD